MHFWRAFDSAVFFFLFKLDMSGRLVKKVHVLNKVIVHLIEEVFGIAVSQGEQVLF